MKKGDFMDDTIIRAIISLALATAIGSNELVLS